MPRFRNMTKQIVNLPHPTGSKTETVQRTLIEDQPDGTRAIREDKREVPASETWGPGDDVTVSDTFAQGAACRAAVKNKTLRKID